MASALMILAQKDYQDDEYAGTRQGLESAGYAITIASTAVGKCSGKFGGREQATIALAATDAALFDMIVFIGGPGAGSFAEDFNAQRIAREAFRNGKKLGAICIAPTILANAGVLQGKRATVWDSGGTQVRILQAGGAVYTGEDVTQDGGIVTANGPHAAEEFGRVLGAMERAEAGQ